MPTILSRAALAASALVVAASGARAGVDGYEMFPAIGPDTIVFAAEGDLWRVPIQGGQANRITTHDGREAFARFSPDGRWIAFSANYDGNVDVYVMPASGGEPRRVTYHPLPDEVVAWTPDSEQIVFRSRRESGQYGEWRLFEVPKGGGFPAQLDLGIAALADFSENGRLVAFNRLSREFRNWKRYRGGTAQDIWIGDMQRGVFRKFTEFEGTDRFPMWHDGRLYYLSDRTGRLNIWSANADGSGLRQHTEHDRYDARWPSMHSGRIAYMHAGDIWVYDIGTGRARKVDVALPSDRIRTRERFENAADTLDYYDLSADGERLAMSSRGEIWTLPVQGGRTVAVTETSGVRDRAPVFAHDAETLAAITDTTGEQELALYDPMGREPQRVLTRRGQGWIFPPVWSPTGDHIAYADLTQALFLVDVESGETTTVYQNEDWEIREYTFSPDGKWLAFTVPHGSWSWKSSIYLYEIATGEVTPITTRWTGDFSPSWDPDGEYLFFLSNRRLNPQFCGRDFQHTIQSSDVPCAIILRADGVSPFVSEEIMELHGPGDDEETDEDDDGDGNDEADDEDGEDADEDELPEVVIDLEGIEHRTVEFPIVRGNFYGLTAVDGRVYFASADWGGLVGDVFDESESRATIHYHDFEEREGGVFLTGVWDFDISDDGSTIAWRTDRGTVHVAPLSGSSPEPEHSFSASELRLGVVPQEEWRQIFDEAWRLQRDFYWADNMAGVDWDTVRSRYRALLDQVGTRDELNDLIGQMIAELGTSHTYVWGGDTVRSESVGVGLLGADLEPDRAIDAYRVRRVLRAEPWESLDLSPLAHPHARVADGDIIWAINGRRLTADENIHRRLARLGGEEVLLTVGSEADGSDQRDVQVETLTSEIRLRYRDWCRQRREYADAQSRGRIGYIHIPNMGGFGLVEFIKGYYPQLDKDALIIDCRYNGGGFVSQMIIERLAREQWAYMKPRRGKTDAYPAESHLGPKAVLTNYFAGSDGDIGPESFKILGLGPVIGTRSWGGVVGIRSDKPFIDGGMSTQPEFAWWEPRRGWDMENSGVYPDIEVDILPEDYLAGRDPQMDTAIEYLLDALRQAPPAPSVPAYPDKSGPMPTPDGP